MKGCDIKMKELTLWIT